MNEWISVKDKMPDHCEYECVITYEIIHNIKTGNPVSMILLEDSESLFLDEDGKVCSDGGGENITHWMPLPKPSKNEI